MQREDGKGRTDYKSVFGEFFKEALLGRSVNVKVERLCLGEQAEQWEVRQHVD